MNLYDFEQRKQPRKSGISKAKETEFHTKLDQLVHNTFGKRKGEMEESTNTLNIGDPVIISGKGINFEGATGEVAEVGREGKFLVVNLYNHGKHSFHSSDVSYNDYADSDDEEARMYDAGEFRDEMDEARANTAGARAGLARRANAKPLSPEEQAAKDKAKADKWLEKERAKVAAKKGSLKEFAPGAGGGESGRWYTDDQMTDLVGDGWWQDLDISGDVSKQEMMHEAQAWLADNGYRVQVLNVKVNDDDCEWFIEGSFQNNRFAKKGVAEASPETSLNLLKGLKTWQVVIMNNYYRGKYSDYSGRYYYVLASSPEEAKQVVLDNADAILQELLAMKSHNGKKILPRGTAVRITPERINGVKDGTEAGRMSTAGFKKMFGPQGPMMVKLSNGAIVDVQGQEQGVAEAVTMDRRKQSSYPNDPATQKHRLDTAKALLSDPKTDPDSRREAAAIVARHEKQGMAEDSLDEVSRGDYYKKATMGKAMAQMSAGFARSPEEREKFNQIAGRRERGLARSKARTDKFWADKAAKDEADRLEQLRAKYAGVDIDAEIAKLKPAIDSAYHEYQYGARNTYSQGRDDYNSLMGRVQELERAKKALAGLEEHIGKVKDGYRLYSHTGKNLGTYPTHAGAEKREKQVNYFKHANEDTEELSELSNELLGQYKKAAGISARDLDKAGKYKQADKRFHGIVQATKKELDNDMKKHQQDEVLESRLASMKRAGYDIE